MKVFRWRAIFALIFFLCLLLVWALLFGERAVKSTLEEAATTSLGTQVDISRLNINVARTSVMLNGIAIADPFDSTKNLVEAQNANIELELEPLLRKKIVVRQFTVHDVQTGTTRDRPARRVDTAGFAPRALREIQRFRSQLSVPLLSLTPVDTIRSIVLNPSQLGTVQAAVALEQRVDSLRTTVTTRVEGLLKQDVVDSAEALLTRLRGQTARTLGVTGVVRAVADIRRLTSRVDSLKRSAESLQRDVRLGFDSVSGLVRALDDARRADYDFARGLLALPTFDAPSIGPALFGDISISTFEKATYWVALAREHAPPGLLPREKPGPKRMRLAGTNVAFVTPQSYPDFLLRRGEMSISLGEAAGVAQGAYTLNVSDVTTEPALIGKPARFELTRSAQTSDVRNVEISGSMDHTTDVLRDVVNLRASGVKLPAFSLPGIPLRVDLGRGESALSFEMIGNNINARWSITSPAPTWQSDSLRGASRSTIEALVTRVISGINSLKIDAELTGTLAAPKLSVSSTLDREIAASIRSVAGEEIAKAEAKIRAQVDSIVDEKVAPLRARVAEVRAQADAKLKEANERIDSLKAELAERLRTLAGGDGDG